MSINNRAKSEQNATSGYCKSGRAETLEAAGDVTIASLKWAEGDHGVGMGLTLCPSLVLCAVEFASTPTLVTYLTFFSCSCFFSHGALKFDRFHTPWTPGVGHVLCSKSKRKQSTNNDQNETHWAPGRACAASEGAKSEVPTGIRTPVGGFKVHSDNHYTIETTYASYRQ